MTNHQWKILCTFMYLMLRWLFGFKTAEISNLGHTLELELERLEKEER